MNEQEEETTSSVYMEGYLHKKEERNKWIEFWVALEGRFLKFQRHKLENENIGNRLIGWIELTKDTKCYMGRRKDYSFPFYIQKPGKRYLFKTVCTLSRHRWVKAIELSIQGKSPCDVPRGLTEISRNCSVESTSSDEISGIYGYYSNKCQRPRQKTTKRNAENFQARSRTKSLDSPSKKCHLLKRSSSAENIIDLDDIPISHPSLTFPRHKGTDKGHRAPIADVKVLTSRNDCPTTYRNAFVFQKEDAYPEVINVDIESDFKKKSRNPILAKTLKPSESSAFTKHNPSNTHTISDALTENRKEKKQVPDGSCVIVDADQKGPIVAIIDDNNGTKKRMGKKAASSVKSGNSYYPTKRSKNASFASADQSFSTTNVLLKNCSSKRERTQTLSKSKSCSSADKDVTSKAKLYSKIPNIKKQNDQLKEPSLGRHDKTKKTSSKKSSNDVNGHTLPRNSKFSSTNIKSQSSSSRGYTTQQNHNHSAIPVLSSKAIKPPTKEITKSTPRPALKNNRKPLKVKEQINDPKEQKLKPVKTPQVRRAQKYRNDTFVSTSAQIHKTEEILSRPSSSQSGGRTPSLRAQQIEEINSHESNVSTLKDRRKSCSDTKSPIKGVQNEKKVNFPKSESNLCSQSDASTMKVIEENFFSDVRKRSYSYTSGDKKQSVIDDDICNKCMSTIDLCRKSNCSWFDKRNPSSQSLRLKSSNNEKDTFTLNGVRQEKMFSEKQEEKNFSSSSQGGNPSSIVETGTDKNVFISGSALSKCIDLRRATSTSSVDTSFIATTHAVTACLKNMGISSISSNNIPINERDENTDLSFDINQLSSSNSATSKKIMSDNHNHYFNTTKQCMESDISGEVLTNNNMGAVSHDTNSTLDSNYTQKTYIEQFKADPIPILKSSKSVEFSEHNLSQNKNNKEKIIDDYPDSVLDEIDRLYRSSSFSAADRKPYLSRILKNAHSLTDKNRPERLRTRSLTASHQLNVPENQSGIINEEKYREAFTKSLPSKRITISEPERIAQNEKNALQNVSYYEQMNIPPIDEVQFEMSEKQIDHQKTKSLPIRSMKTYSATSQKRVEMLPNTYAWNDLVNEPFNNHEDPKFRFCSPGGEMSLSEISAERNPQDYIPPPYQFNQGIDSDVEYVGPYSTNEILSPRDSFIYSPFTSTNVQFHYPSVQSNNPNLTLQNNINNVHRTTVLTSPQSIIYEESPPIEYQSPSFVDSLNSNTRFCLDNGREIIVNLPNETAKHIEQLKVNFHPAAMSFSANSQREGGILMNVSTTSLNDGFHRLTPSGEDSNASSVSEISGKKNANSNVDYALSDRLKEILIQGDKFGSMTYLNCDKSKNGIRGMSKEKGGIFNKMFWRTKQNTKKENCF